MGDQHPSCAFLLPELAGQTGHSVNRTKHFEGMVLQFLKNSHSKNGARYFEEI